MARKVSGDHDGQRKKPPEDERGSLARPPLGCEDHTRNEVSGIGSRVITSPMKMSSKVMIARPSSGRGSAPATPFALVAGSVSTVPLLCWDVRR